MTDGGWRWVLLQDNRGRTSDLQIYKPSYSTATCVALHAVCKCMKWPAEMMPSLMDLYSRSREQPVGIAPRLRDAKDIDMLLRRRLLAIFPPCRQSGLTAKIPRDSSSLTTTRRIPEYEWEFRLNPCVIIALSGLAAADTQQEPFFQSGCALVVEKDFGRVQRSRGIALRTAMAVSCMIARRKFPSSGSFRLQTRHLLCDGSPNPGQVRGKRIISEAKPRHDPVSYN